MDRNKHVKEYLAYYAAFPKPPRYAVMLDGRWGIGKTFMLKEFIDTIKTGEFSVVYVSLNGLKSNDEIDKALFRSMHAVMGNKFFEAGASLAKGALKAWKGVSIDINLLDLVNRYASNLYIFDDLERCELPIKQALGYINAFVEHGDRKVIVVANEAEIDEPDKYRRIREKLIGKTLQMHSAFEQALDAFFNSIADSRARAFLKSKAQILGTIYDQAELHNLRILQQTMWDFERFYIALEDKHRENDGEMTELLRMLFALSIEFKSGRITTETLQNRKHPPFAAFSRSKGMAVPHSPFELASARYPEATLGSTALSDGTLVDLLAKGIFDASAIRSELDLSTYFVVVANEPAWRTVWYSIERTDAQVADAIIKMEASFAAREYTIIGEMLHVFGIRLKLSRIGEFATAYAGIVAECKRYIDDLYDAKRLEPSKADDSIAGFLSTGYGGLQIASSDMAEYLEIFRYLRAKQETVAVERYPDAAGSLLTDMVDDSDRFLDRITYGRGSSGDLARTPVLAALQVDAFVATFLGLHPIQQRTVLQALKSRYEHSSLQGDLANELQWAQDVRQNLLQEASTMSPIGRERLHILLENTLDTVSDLLVVPPAPVLPPSAAPPPAV